MDDFASDFLAPSFALIGIGVTGYKSYRQIDWNQIRAPWRTEEAILNQYGQHGQELRTQMVQYWSNIRRGTASQPHLKNIRDLLTGTVAHPVFGKNIQVAAINEFERQAAWAITAKRFGMREPTALGELLQTSAWTADDLAGIDLAGITNKQSAQLIEAARASGAVPEGLIPVLGDDRVTGLGQLEDVLSRRPEMAEELARQLKSIKGAGLVPHTEQAAQAFKSIPAMEAVRFGYFNQQGSFRQDSWMRAGTALTVEDRMSQLAALGMEGREDMARAINQIVEEMGPDTRFQLGFHKEIGEGKIPLQMRFRNNQAILPLPLTTRINGLKTMYRGKYGVQQTTPMHVVRDWQMHKYLEASRLAENPNLIGGPPIKDMDVYLAEELKTRYQELTSGARSPRAVEDRAMRMIEDEFEEIFETNTYVRGRGAEHTTGTRGIYDRSAMVIKTTDRAHRPVEVADINFQPREMVQRLADVGVDVLRQPSAMANNVFTVPGQTLDRYNILGVATQPRPDQLHREARADLANINKVGGYEFQPRVQSHARLMEGRVNKDPLLSLRVAVGSEEAWREIATMEDLPAHMRTIGAEEFLASRDMKRFRYGRDVPGFIVDPTTSGAWGKRFRRIEALLGANKDLADAMANGKIEDYVSRLYKEGADAYAKTVEDAITFDKGEKLGWDRQGKIIRAGKFEGRFQLTHLRPLAEGGYYIGGKEIFGLGAGDKFQGTKLTKKTVKDFMFGGRNRFQALAAKHVALSEWMVRKQVDKEYMGIIDLLAADQGISPEAMLAREGRRELFGRRGRFKDRASFDHMMKRVKGVSMISTEGYKAAGGADLSNFMHSVAHETVHRIRKNIKPLGMSKKEWADRKAAATSMLERGHFEITDRGTAISRATGQDPIFVRNQIMKAATELGIIDPGQAGTTLDALLSKTQSVADNAWSSLSDVYGMAGIWSGETAIQGTPVMHGAGKIGTANRSVIEALRVQGANEISTELLEATSGKAKELYDLFQMAGVLQDDIPEKTVDIGKLATQLSSGELEGIFALDPSERRAAWGALGVSPGDDFAVDLGRDYEVAGRRLRHIRPGMVSTGFIGGMEVGGKEILKTVDARMQALLQAAAQARHTTDNMVHAEVNKRAEAYFKTVAQAVEGKRKAGKHALAGEVADSVMLQYQSGIDGAPTGHGVRQAMAERMFNLSEEERTAWRTGKTAGRVHKGAIVGTAWRQPIEGLYRVATTKFYNVDRFIEDSSHARSSRAQLKNMKEYLVWADQAFAAAFGADHDGDIITLHALSRQNQSTFQVGLGTVLTHDVLRGDPKMSQEALMDVLAKEGITGDIARKSVGLGQAQHTYLEMQGTFQKLLKSKESRSHILDAAFRTGEALNADRLMKKFTAAELEKQIVGHISNVANVSFTAYSQTTQDPAKIRSAGLFLGNLVERIIKAKYVPENEKLTASKRAMEAVAIMRKGDVTRVDELKSIVETLFQKSSATQEGRQMLGDVMSVTEDILRATARFKAENPAFGLEQAFSQRSGHIENILRARGLAMAEGNTHPAAALYQAMMGGEPKARSFWSKTSSAASQIAEVVGRNKAGAMIGIGAALGTSLLLGDPTSKLDQGMVSQREARQRHESKRSTPQAEIPATARIAGGSRTEVRAVAGGRMDSYNTARNLSGIIGGTGDMDYRVHDSRSHVDEDYIKRKLGI